MGWMVRGSSPRGGEIFRTCPDRPWCPPRLLYKRYWVFPGGKERPGRDVDPSHFLVPWSRKSRAICTSNPLWAVRPVLCLSACTREHLYFYLTLYMHNKSYNVKTYTLTRRFYEDGRICPNSGRTSVSAKKKKKKKEEFFSMGCWAPRIYGSQCFTDSCYMAAAHIFQA